MFDEILIDSLIQAGWHVLESDFDEEAFVHWRRLSSLCLGNLLGHDHVYVRLLKDYVRQAEKTDVLTGEGILSVAREEILKRSPREDTPECTCRENGMEQLPSHTPVLRDAQSGSDNESKNGVLEVQTATIGVSYEVLQQ